MKVYQFNMKAYQIDMKAYQLEIKAYQLDIKKYNNLVTTLICAHRRGLVVPCLANSSAMQLPTMSRCPGTHIRLIVN